LRMKKLPSYMDSVLLAIVNIIIMILKNKKKGKKGYMFVYLKGIHTIVSLFFVNW
jgi:hypothetical protein